MTGIEFEEFLRRIQRFRLALFTLLGQNLPWLRKVLDQCERAVLNSGVVDPVHGDIPELSNRLRTWLGVGNDPRYTPTTCFETFPLPWPPGHESWRDPRIHAIANAANALDEARRAYLDPPGATPDVLKKRTLTNLYNMACLKALTNHPDEAVAYLERAADSGFTDFLHIEKDEDLKSLRDLPRYKTFIAAKDQYQQISQEVRARFEKHFKVDFA